MNATFKPVSSRCQEKNVSCHNKCWCPVGSKGMDLCAKPKRSYLGAFLLSR